MIAYTDGSTTPRGKYANSGLAIVLTDHMNKVFWSGGMIIRADGNNFIAELAAASMVIKAIPSTLTTSLRMDSKAAIGAISKRFSLRTKKDSCTWSCMAEFLPSGPYSKKKGT